ncbi:14889_t:CDS:2, partial [Cetraspora pellucida]
YKCGNSLATIAKNIKCSKTIVYNTLKRYAQTGSTMPRKCPGPKAIFNESALEELKKMIIQDTKHHRLSLKEIQDLWKKEKNQKVSIFTIRYTLKKCVWHTPAEEFDESCLVSTVGYSPGLMFWECFSWHGLGPIVSIYSTINGEVYTRLIRRHAISAIHQLVPNRQ